MMRAFIRANLRLPHHPLPPPPPPPPPSSPCRVLNGILVPTGRRWSTTSSSSSHDSPFPVLPSQPAPFHASQKDKNLMIYQMHRTREQEILAAQATDRERGGAKLGVRERLSLLVDEGSEVLEIGMLAGLGMPYGDVPCGGNLVCVADVCGEKCVVSANDWTVKGGCTFPITLKKQLRAQEIALQNHLPCIYLVDSGGAFLPLQSEIYPDKEHGGRVFRTEAILSSLGVPQIAVVAGSCTAGGAYVPSMCDEVVMVDKAGSLYLGGPPLVRIATGEVLTSEELGGARVHCSISGCTDHFATSDQDAMRIVRSIVSSLNLRQNPYLRRVSVEPPLYSSTDEEFAGLIPDSLEQWPILELIARVVDGSKLQQFKETFGCNLITGFARLNGYLIGLVANQGSLDEASALKGAHFIRLCSLRGIPLVFLVNTPSERDFLSPSGSPGLTAKARAQMMSVLATAPVPKITIVLGGSYGPSAYAMCGRAMEPNFMFCWPHAKMGVASSEDILEMSASRLSKEDVVRDESTHPTSSLLHDGVVLPSQTRQIIQQCLDITCKYSKWTTGDQPNLSLGVLRM